MRKLLTLLVLFVSAYCSAQNVRTRSTGYDTIPIETDITVDGCPIYSSKAKLSNIFKKKDSTSIGSGMGDCQYATTWYLKKSAIYLCDSIFDGFELKDNTLRLSINGIRFKIGDTDNELKRIYAISYAKREKVSDTETGVYIYFIDNSFLRFVIDNHSIITSIGYWEDNS